MNPKSLIIIEKAVLEDSFVHMAELNCNQEYTFFLKKNIVCTQKTKYISTIISEQTSIEIILNIVHLSIMFDARWAKNVFSPSHTSLCTDLPAKFFTINTKLSMLASKLFSATKELPPVTVVHQSNALPSELIWHVLVWESLN